MSNTTDPQEEIFPVVNSHDEVIGKITRSQAHKSPKIIHRAAGVFIYNANDEILIQKRSFSKDTFPDCWDISVGGHVKYGDEYLNTATRELSEEIGIKIKADDLRLIGKLLVKLPWEQEFWQLYRYDLLQNSKFRIKKSELSETRFISIKELKNMLNDQNTKWSDKARQEFNKIIFNR